MTDSTVKIRVWVRTDKIGSMRETETEYEKDDWDSMSDLERKQELNELIWNMAEWGYEEQP